MLRRPVLSLQTCAGIIIGCLCCENAAAQERSLPSVSVTANRVQQRLFDSPSVDGIEIDARNASKPAVSISEVLITVPGIAVRERQNLAQDVQLAIRGFGSRATFGTRGSRLLVDGIPASTPDGQGQASTINMGSAGRVEIVRGPWAQMYGNVGGGVMLVETSPAPKRTEADMRVAVGSREFRQIMLHAGGPLASNLGMQADVSAFSTEGAREHSAAKRRYLDLRMDGRLGTDTSIRLGINSFSQPLAQDPLGLTRGDYQDNPRRVSPLALQFDTRKRVDQVQIGASGEHRVGPRDRMTVSGYAGRRQVRQFLAFSGAAPTSSGGVVDLDRTYYGAAAAWHRNFGSADRIPVRWSIGSEIEAMRDRRLGFVNASGDQGDMRRDEDNDATTFGLHAQAAAYVDPDVLLSAGGRYTRVDMRVDDRYITGASPDDSGRMSFNRFSPVTGVLWHVTETLNAFANFGYGFETPTVSELAYRETGSGFNFALRPARSRHSEAGLKSQQGNLAFQATIFHSATDGEIVPLANQGGRTIFRNVDGVERYGIELGGKATWRSADWTLAYTFLQAKFTEGFVGADGRPVNAGNRLPGTARHALHLEAGWKLTESARLGANLHAESRVNANDVNSEAAPGYVTLGLTAERSMKFGNRPASIFLRIDNLLDRRYIGSVIVNEANGRFYEPAAGRTLFAGLRMSL